MKTKSFLSVETLSPNQRRIIQLLAQQYRENPLGGIPQVFLEKKLGIKGYVQEIIPLRDEGWLISLHMYIGKNKPSSKWAEFATWGAQLGWKMTAVGLHAIADDAIANYQLNPNRDSWKAQVLELLCKLQDSPDSPLRREATALIITMPST